MLHKQEYTSTSVKIMLLNVSAFIKHLKTFHPEVSGLTTDQMDRILLQLKRLQRNNARSIKGHQQHIRRNKSSEYTRPCTTTTGHHFYIFREHP